MRPWRRRGELLALAAGCYAGVCVCAAAIGNRGGEGSREERDEGEIDVRGFSLAAVDEDERERVRIERWVSLAALGG